MKQNDHHKNPKDKQRDQSDQGNRSESIPAKKNTNTFTPFTVILKHRASWDFLGIWEARNKMKSFWRSTTPKMEFRRMRN